MIEVGVGTSEFVTYIMKFTNSDGEVLWEGFVDGKPVQAPDGSWGVTPKALPRDLFDILRTIPVYHAEWVEAWEDVTHAPERLVAESSERSKELGEQK